MAGITDYNAGEIPHSVVVVANFSSTDSTGAPLPANFDNLPQVLAYDGSNNLTSVAKTNGTNTWTQTLTYTAGNLTAVSAWVKS